MVTGYRVERNKLKQTPYYGLKAFEKNKGPIDHLLKKKDCIEMLQSFSLLGRTCFNEAFRYINEQTLSVLDPCPIF